MGARRGERPSLRRAAPRYFVAWYIYRYQWARNHCTYANKQAEVMSLAGYSEFLRQSSGRLGYLMTTNPHEGQTDHLKQALTGIEQAGQSLEKVINFPLQRYNGRTPVHLAASNGLWECLEILLKNGGEL